MKSTNKIELQNVGVFKKAMLFLLLVFIIIACQNKTTLPDPLQAGWKGESVCEVLDENEKLRTLKCTFAPGVGHEKHYHPPHFGYTLSGSIFRITDDKGTREVNVKTGTHFSKEIETWHEVLNVGDSTAVFLIVEPK